jgi:hypothetical protein
MENNPWLNISWNKTIADCDRSYFEHNQVSNQVSFDCLPEPYSGNINSNVYCLNANPGPIDDAFKNDSTFEYLTQQTLNHQLPGTMWDKKYWGNKVHPGTTWLYKHTAKLRRDCNKGDILPNLCFIDYFPYHSDHIFNFPKDLPSNKYRNYLITKAIQENKYIILFRQKKTWLEEIVELKKYPNLFELRSNQNVSISSTNIKPVNGGNIDDLIIAMFE